MAVPVPLPIALAASSPMGRVSAAVRPEASNSRDPAADRQGVAGHAGGKRALIATI